MNGNLMSQPTLPASPESKTPVRPKVYPLKEVGNEVSQCSLTPVLSRAFRLS